MLHFHYQALSAEGELIDGELQAANVLEAVTELEARGLTVQSIGHGKLDSPTTRIKASEERVDRKSGTSKRQKSKSDTDEQLELLRSHMTSVLDEAKPIVPALRAYAEEMSPGRRRRELYAVLGLVERGDVAAAADALGSLPDYWMPLLSAAASSRDPGRVLSEFVEHSQQADELRRQWWSTLTYPLFVAGIAIAVFVAMSFLVIPVFREMFDEFDMQVPGFTMLILNVSYWITSGQILIAIALLVLVGAIFVIVKRTMPAVVDDWFGDRFSMPFGRATAIVRIARFLADLLEARLDVPDALRIAGTTARKPRLRRAAWQLAQELEREISGTERQHRPALTATVLHALQSEMPSASRIELLRVISHCHADRARNRLSWTRGIVEPVTICIVGIMVGAIVLALFLPLMKLIEGLA